MGINKTLTVLDHKCEAMPEPMTGTGRKVLRILSVTVLAILVTAGCGSSAGGQRAARGLPRSLAHTWAVQASEIAAAAAARDGCRARRLAGTLRTEVISARGRVPTRLQSPLLEAVNSLADRIVCVVPPVTVTTNPQPPPKPAPKPKGHGAHDHHGHGGGKGDQG
jgi:hypothetical protein